MKSKSIGRNLIKSDSYFGSNSEAKAVYCFSIEDAEDGCANNIQILLQSKYGDILAQSYDPASRQAPAGSVHDSIA